MDDLHLVPVATGVSDFEAKLLAARLGADGILWQMRGVVDSIYPFGGIDVLVPRDQLEDARQVLAVVTERVHHEVGPGAADAPDPTGWSVPDGAPVPVAVDLERAGPPWWLGLAAVAALVAVVMGRLLVLG